MTCAATSRPRLHRLAAGAALLLSLAACGEGGSAAAPPSPTLALTPTTGSVQAGEAALPLTATLVNSTEAINWSLSPADVGSLSAATGAAVSYTPPATALADATVTVTATAAGISRSATLTVTPSVVVALGVAPRSASTADLTFTMAYGSPLSFGVWRSTVAGEVGVNVVKNLPAGTTSWRDSGLVGGTTYQYTVTAGASGSRSYHSAQIAVTTLAPAAFPAAPTGLAATFVPGDGRLTLDAYTLSWDPYPGATYYIVQSTPVAELIGNGPLSALEGVPTEPTLSGLGLAAGTTGYYWVEAYDQVGQRLSAPAVVRIDDAGLPGRQTFVAAPVLDPGSSAPDLDAFRLHFYGAPGAAAHHVYLGSDPGVAQPHTVATPALDGPPTALAIREVKPGYFRIDIPLSVLSGLGVPTVQLAVEAVAPGGPGYASASPWLAVTLPPPILVPLVVTGLRGERRNPHLNRLSWDAVAGATGYAVHRLASPTEVPGDLSLIGTTTGTTFDDTGMAPGSAAYYRVAWLDTKGGGSEPSASERVQTLIDGAPWLDPLVLVLPFNWHAWLTFLGHNDGTSFHVYSWYARTLFPIPVDSSHLELTVSPGADGMTPWVAVAQAPLIVAVPLLPLPAWGCWWLREVYPDGSQSPLSLPACMAFPSP